MNNLLFCLCLVTLIILLYIAYKKDCRKVKGEISHVKKVCHNLLTSGSRGALAGFITGGLPAAFTSALVFGVSGPIITAIEEFYPPNHML